MNVVIFHMLLYFDDIFIGWGCCEAAWGCGGWEVGGGGGAWCWTIGLGVIAGGSLKADKKAIFWLMVSKSEAWCRIKSLWLQNGGGGGVGNDLSIKGDQLLDQKAAVLFCAAAHLRDVGEESLHKRKKLFDWRRNKRRKWRKWCRIRR